jgi:hypothetical protein
MAFAGAVVSLIGVGPAFAGLVTVSDQNGQVGSYSQIADAMAWISAEGNASSMYSVWASSSEYIGFEAVENSTLSWGNSPGVLEIDGTMRVRSTSSLTVEVGGLSNALATSGGPVDYDTILCTGLVKIEGAVNIQLVGGFVPVYGNTFEIIASGTDVQLLPTATINGPALGGGLSWQMYVGDSTFSGPDYGAKSLFVTVVPSPGAIALIGLAGLVARRRK